MSFVMPERTRERTETTGNGLVINLAGTISPNQRTFDVGVGVGNSTFYEIVSGDGLGWEIGIGHVPASGQLSRDTVLENHLGTTARISLVGESRAFVTMPGNLGLAFTNIFGGNFGKNFLRWNIRTNVWEATVGNATWHQAAALATTAALPACTYNNGPNNDGVNATLTGNSNGLLVVDSINVALNYRILVKNEASNLHNGLYDVTATGDASHHFILTRCVDYDDPTDLAEGDCVSVGPAGTVNGKTIWMMSTADSSINIGSTTDITWTQVAPSSGGGGSIALDDLTDVATAGAVPGDSIVYNGTDWEPGQPGVAVATKSGTGLTTTAGTSVTVTDTDAGILIDTTASGINGGIVYKTPPATPYTIKAKIATALVNACCFGFYDGTKLEAILPYFVQGGNSLNGSALIFTASALASFNATIASSAGAWLANPFWAAIQNDGTNIKYYMSHDGVKYVLMYSHTISGGYLSAYNHVFVGNFGADGFTTIEQWIESSP